MSKNFIVFLSCNSSSWRWKSKIATIKMTTTRLKIILDHSIKHKTLHESKKYYKGRKMRVTSAELIPLKKNEKKKTAFKGLKVKRY